jgi:hemerythrin
VFAEVIRGRFGGKAAVDTAVDSGPYVLPNAARIGLPVLDQAHAALLARLNAAHRDLSSGHEAEARLQLEMLRSDLVTHFDIEEQIMQGLGFAGMRGQVRRHATITAKFDEICRASLSRGSFTVSDLDLCFQNLIDEVMRGDVDLKSHFQTMGSRRSAQEGA